MKKLFISLASIGCLIGCTSSNLYFTDKAELNIDSSPMGARICAAHGQCFGQTPITIEIDKKYLAKVESSPDGDCWQPINDFVVTWVSGAKVTGNFRWCGRPVQRVSHTFFRPDGGDLKADIEHETRVSMALAQQRMVNNQQLMMIQMMQMQTPHQTMGTMGPFF